jgi:hypothetical protein
MLPLPTPSIKRKEKEKDENHIGGLLMDLAEGGSEDGTSTSTKKDAGTVPPVPTKKDTSTTLPAPTGKEDGTTLDKPTDHKQMGIPKSDPPSTSGSESCSPDDDDTEDEEYLSCFLELLGLDPDWKRMLDD